MHEFFAAKKIVEIITKKFSGKNISKLEVSIGKNTNYSEHALQHYLNILKKNTLLEKSVFEFRQVKGTNLKITGIDFKGEKNENKN